MTESVELVGGLMQDLAARIAPEVRDPAALLDVASLGFVPAPGGYLFSTIHRGENRTPDAIRSWATMLRTVARPERPVVLALHPGTRAALEASGQKLGPDVRLTPPLGYRSSLTLQMHAAAVLTDSGGVQREAGWLEVPCLVLRSTTEWVELEAASGGRMVLVGLDKERAIEELARWAPVGQTGGLALARVAEVAVPASGAAAAIANRLAKDLVRP